MSDFVKNTLILARATDRDTASAADLEALKSKLQLVYGYGASATNGEKGVARGFVRAINVTLRARQEAAKVVSPIAAALAPHKAAAMDFAEGEAVKSFDAAVEIMKAAGWNLQIAAPYPKTTEGKTAYRLKMARRNALHTLFVTDRLASDNAVRAIKATGAATQDTYHIIILKLDAARRASFIASQREQAGHEFDSYVFKLVGKIGACEQATYEGVLWQGSRLTVRRADGTVEVWSTKQIINCSVLGTLYHQWPTRQLRAAELIATTPKE